MTPTEQTPTLDRNAAELATLLAAPDFRGPTGAFAARLIASTNEQLLPTFADPAKGQAVYQAAVNVAELYRRGAALFDQAVQRCQEADEYARQWAEPTARPDNVSGADSERVEVAKELEPA